MSSPEVALARDPAQANVVPTKAIHHQCGQPLVKTDSQGQWACTRCLMVGYPVKANL